MKSTSEVSKLAKEGKAWYWTILAACLIPLFLFITWPRNGLQLPVWLTFYYVTIATALLLHSAWTKWAYLQLLFSIGIIVGIGIEAFTVGISNDEFGPGTYIWTTSTFLLLGSISLAILCWLYGKLRRLAKQRESKAQDSNYPSNTSFADKHMLAVELDYRKLSWLSWVFSFVLMILLASLLYSGAYIPVVVVCVLFLFRGVYLIVRNSLLVISAPTLSVVDDEFLIDEKYTAITFPWKSIAEAVVKSKRWEKFLWLRLNNPEEVGDSITLRRKLSPGVIFKALYWLFRFLNIFALLLASISQTTDLVRGYLGIFGRAFESDEEKERAYLKSVWQSNFKRVGFHVCILDIWSIKLPEIERAIAAKLQQE